MSMLTLQMPALPDPVRVVLQPATTALLVFDMIDRICKNQPNCTGVMVPALASLLARAREAGVFVLYSTREPESSKWMPEVAPAPDDPVVKSVGQDRFYNTDLDKTLKALPAGRSAARWSIHRSERHCGGTRSLYRQMPA